MEAAWSISDLPPAAPTSILAHARISARARILANARWAPTAPMAVRVV